MRGRRDQLPRAADLGVRTAEVKQGALTSTVEAVGSVAYNERDVAVVQARSNGFLERLYVRAPLDPVRKGQPLAELYVPDWVAAQEEYLSAKRIGARSDAANLAGLADAAKQRMRLAGMSDAQIAGVEAGGKVQARSTITAPIAGVIGELTAAGGHDGNGRCASVPDQWTVYHLDQRRGSRGCGGASAPRQSCGSPNARGVRYGIQRKGKRDPARSESSDAHDQGTDRNRQPERPACPRDVRYRQLHARGAQGGTAGPVRSRHSDRQAQRCGRRAR